MHRRIMLGLFLVVGMTDATVWADTVELANGDLLSGKVSAVNAEHVLLASDLLGEVKLPRAKVAAIHFGERKPAAKPSAAAPAPGVTSKAPPAEPTVDDVLNQLKAGGAGGDLTKMLQKEFPLLQNPAVKTYFDKTVGGLMSGELDVSDIRQQAIDARNQVKELEKELGPEGMAALRPYLSVLDKFIQDTEHLQEKKPAKPKP